MTLQARPSWGSTFVQVGANARPYPPVFAATSAPARPFSGLISLSEIVDCRLYFSMRCVNVSRLIPMVSVREGKTCH